MTIRSLNIRPVDLDSELAARINPYEDWDTRTLPLTRTPRTRWHPVYCALLPTETNGPRRFVEAALALKQLLESTEDGDGENGETDRTLVAPQSTFLILNELIAPPGTPELLPVETQSNDQREEVLVQIYRKPRLLGSEIYQPLSDDTAELIEIRQVFPAIPAVEKDIDIQNLRFIPDPDANVDRSASSFTPTRVFTAIIDDEIGYLNARFRHSKTQTRIERFWSMALEDLEEQDDPQVPFGVVLEDREINDQLTQLADGQTEAKLYADFDAERIDFDAKPLQRTRFRDPNYRRPRALVESHGTAVLDLAAGREPVAEVDHNIADPILAVELPQLAVAETNGYRLQNYILSAVEQILYWADTLDTFGEGNSQTSIPAPVVINLSFGNHAGSKDGMGWLEQRLKDLIDARNKTVSTKIVLAAGNNRLSRGRAVFDAGSEQTVDWRVQPDDATDTYLEFRTEQADGSTFVIDVPELGATFPIPLNVPAIYTLHPEIADLGVGDIIGAIYVQPKNHGTDGLIALAPTRANSRDGVAPSPAGRYGITFTAPSGCMTVILEAQRDDTPTGYEIGARQSYLDVRSAYEFDNEGAKSFSVPSRNSPLKREGTLSAFATGDSDNIVVVGGVYSDFVDPSPRPAPYSSAGSGRFLARQRPSFSAVSDDAFVQFGRTTTGLYSGSSAVFSGTSMATAVVTRELVAKIRAGDVFGSGVAVSTAIVKKPAQSKHKNQAGDGVAAEAAMPPKPKRVPTF